MLDPWNPDHHDPVESPVAPDRHHEIVAVRDRTKAGPTCPCNLAPLCRRHHRVKTHGGFSYTTLEPGVYLWTTRHGHQYLRDHHGTIDVTPDRRRAPD